MSSMYIIKVGLGTDSFNKMKAGIKRMEFRLREGKWETLRAGDIIEFERKEGSKRYPHDVLRVEVLAVVNYPTFADLVKDFSPATYTKKTKEEQLRELREIYNKEQERMHTVIGIKIKFIQ